MPEREVISNTSPLLYLYQVDQLDLLHKLYGRVERRVKSTANRPAGPPTPRSRNPRSHSRYPARVVLIPAVECSSRRHRRYPGADHRNPSRDSRYPKRMSGIPPGFTVT